MSTHDDIARRYADAWQRGDDAELIALEHSIAPAAWPSVAAAVRQIDPSAMPVIDAARFETSAREQGLDAELAGVAAAGLTADIATLLETHAADEALADRFCEAAPSLEAADAGRVRFQLGQLRRRLIDASRLTDEAIAALAGATGASMAYVRTLAAGSSVRPAAGLAARSTEQHAGEPRVPRVIDPRVDPLFGIADGD